MCQVAWYIGTKLYFKIKCNSIFQDNQNPNILSRNSNLVIRRTSIVCKSMKILPPELCLHSRRKVYKLTTMGINAGSLKKTMIRIVYQLMHEFDETRTSWINFHIRTKMLLKATKFQFLPVFKEKTSWRSIHTNLRYQSYHFREVIFILLCSSGISLRFIFISPSVWSRKLILLNLDH